MTSESHLFLLLLVGADTTNLRSSLTAIQPFIGGWVAVDTGSGDSRALIEGCFPGIPGTFATRPWKGEVANRKELLRLTPWGEGHALLLDSSMSVAVDDTFDLENLTSDYVLTKEGDGRFPRWRCLIFRRSLGHGLEVVDNVFVKVDDNELSAKVPGMTISRPISREPFHSFRTSQAFITLSEKYVHGGKLLAALSLLHGALDGGLSSTDVAAIHVQLARIYANESRFAEAFMQYSNAFLIEKNLFVEKMEAVIMLNVAKEFRLADRLLTEYLLPQGRMSAVNDAVEEWQLLLESGVAKHGLGDVVSAKECFGSIVNNPDAPEAFRDVARSNLAWC